MADNPRLLAFRPPAQSKDEDGFLFLTVFAFLLVGLLTRWQDDTWWLLRTGLEILRDRRIPQFDSLSLASDPHSPLQLHEWLSSVVMYSFFRVGGHAAVQLLFGFCLGLIGMLLAFWVPGSSRQRAFVLLSILPFFVLTLSARPHIFGYLFLVALLVLLQRKRFLYIPIVFILWAQCHASVIVGLIYVAVYLFALSVRDRSRIINSMALVCCCIFATASSPLGWDLFFFVFRSTQRLYQLPLQEWQALTWNSVPGVYLVFVAVIPLIFVPLDFKAFLKSADSLTCALFSVVFFVEGLFHIRYLTIWGIFYAGALGYASSHGDQRSSPLDINNRLGAPLLVLFIGFYLSVSLLLGRILGWYPLDSLGMRELRSAPGPRFTTYNTGGFNLWFDQDTKSFIDSRQDPFSLDTLKDVINARQDEDLQPIFSRWGFKSALVEVNSFSFGFLSRSGWILKWRNDQLAVFVNPGPEQQVPGETQQ